MGYWVDQSGAYSEGDQPSTLAVEVTKRPDYTCQWVDGVWTNSTLQEQQDRETKLSELADSDITITRIVDAVVTGTSSWTNTDVVAFINWRKSLRADIANNTNLAGPRPPYPAGT